MTDPTKPASGSDPKMSEKEVAAEWLANQLVELHGGDDDEIRKIIAKGWWDRELELLAAYASSREAANEKLIGELVKALETSAITIHYGRYHQFHLFEMCEAVECIDARELLARARGGQKK